MAWVPGIGARIVKYQIAAPLVAVSALIGALLFGDRLAPVYGGYLNTHWTVTQDLPELTLYAMMAWPAVLLVWLVTALWMQIPAVPYLGYGMHDYCLLQSAYPRTDRMQHCSRHKMLQP